eukprot:2987378-Pyramimonas_sp.AAC.1
MLQLLLPQVGGVPRVVLYAGGTPAGVPLPPPAGGRVGRLPPHFRSHGRGAGAAVLQHRQCRGRPRRLGGGGARPEG